MCSQLFITLPELIALYAMLFWMRLRIKRQGRTQEVASVLSYTSRGVSGSFTAHLMSPRDV